MSDESEITKKNVVCSNEIKQNKKLQVFGRSGQLSPPEDSKVTINKSYCLAV